ncbi:hypothetical protein V9K67_21780 [Paraflavisolibacter sp. H34]|uniref:hypothetical protein n=1 Tax=Huijunlia imazamoxiresistens TaxID=3127457 RepID=UPI003018774D
MSWNNFLLLISVIYLLYYSILIVYDKLKNPALLQANGAGGQEFDVQDFLGEQPVQVTAEAVQSPAEAFQPREAKQPSMDAASIGGAVVSYGMDMKELVRAAQEGSIQHTADVDFGVS